MSKFSFDNLRGSRYESQLRRVLQMIEEAAAADWSASESGAFERAVSVLLLCQAQGVYMSPTSLKNHFKRAIGMSIGEYAKERRAAYMGRLFATRPDMMSKDIADRVGLANAPALYPFAKSLGVDDPQTLRDVAQFNKTIAPSFTASLKAFNALSISHYGDYTDFNEPKFEDEWDILEQIATESWFEVKAYIGIAIDDFIRKNSGAGMFTAGIEIEALDVRTTKSIDKRFSLISIPASEYLVFTLVGDYENLVEFYSDVLASVKNSTKYVFNPDGVMFEKYLNSQKGTPSSSLVTELWIPVAPV